MGWGWDGLHPSSLHPGLTPWTSDLFEERLLKGHIEILTTFSACTHAYTKFGFPTSPHVHVVGLWEEDGPSEESGERSGNG